MFAKIAKKNPSVWEDFKYVSDQILDMYKNSGEGRVRTVINNIATIAIRHNNMDLFQDLLSRGADDFGTFIYMAADTGNMSLLKNLMQSKKMTAQAVYHAFSRACEGGHLEIVKYLTEKIENPSWNILMQGFYLACQEDKIHVVKYLIEKYGIEKFDIQYAIDYQSDIYSKVRQYLKSLI